MGSWWNDWRNPMSFVIIGTINNLAYVVVTSAAQSLADTFDAARYLGLITWANVGLGFFARALNAFGLEGVPYKLRVGINGIVYLLGLIGVAFSDRVNFAFCLASIVLIGAASSFGESVILGYLRKFPGDSIGSWSTGTGLAGVLGSALYLALSIKLSNRVIFLMTLVVVPIYLWAFFFGVSEAAAKEIKKPLLINEIAGSEKSSDEEDTSDSNKNASEDIVGEKWITRILRCCKIQWWYALNVNNDQKKRYGGIISIYFQICLVYFFEYIISTACAHSANTDCHSFKNSYDKCIEHPQYCRWEGQCENLPAETITDTARINAYAVLSFCYQVGVMISRSSLRFVKIKRIGILTILQGINLAVWLIQDMLRIFPVWVQFLLMIYVGLLGGGSYVNAFHQLHQDPKIPAKDKEVVINIAALFINFGIVSAACVSLILYATMLSHTV